MPQAERRQQHPKKLFAQGPQKKKKTKPNPKLPVRGTSAEAEPVTGFWFWLWSWALGNGLRPACLPGTMEFKACTAKKQKNKRERERGREASRAFAAFINFEYKAALKNWTEKKNGAQNALTVFYTDTHRDTRAQLYVYYMICFFYFINTFFLFLLFRLCNAVQLGEAWNRCYVQPALPDSSSSILTLSLPLSPSLCLMPINVLYWFLNCVVIVVQIIKVFRLCQATLLNYGQTFVFWP